MPYIVTHSGCRAHSDEVITCMLLLSWPGAEFTHIERRDPTANELVDRDVWVIDVGESYVPNLRNFDHHHLKGNMIALTQVLHHIMSDMDLVYEVWGWLKFLEMVDNHGLSGAADKYKTTPGTLTVSRSPIEIAIVNMFASCDVISMKKNAPVFHLLRMLGAEMWKSLDKSIQQFSELKHHVIYENVTINPSGDVIGIVDLRSFPYDNPALMLSLFLRKQQMYPLFSLTVNDSSRTSIRGTTIFKRDAHRDTNKYDLSRLHGHPQCVFAHKKRFLALTTIPITTSINDVAYFIRETCYIADIF